MSDEIKNIKSKIEASTEAISKLQSDLDKAESGQAEEILELWKLQGGYLPGDKIKNGKGELAFAVSVAPALGYGRSQWDLRASGTYKKYKKDGSLGGRQFTIYGFDEWKKVS